MKKLISVLITLLLIVSLYACGGQGSGSQAAADSQGTDTKVSETADAMKNDSPDPDASDASDAQEDSGPLTDTSSIHAIKEVQKADVILPEYVNEEGDYGEHSEFIGEEFYDGEINDENDAIEAIESVADRIKLDEDTELVLDNIYENDEGVTYYSFKQALGSVNIYSSAVKLIVNEDKKAAGLVSTLSYGYTINEDDKWEIDGAEAEKIVEERFADEGIKVVKDAADQTLLTNDYVKDYYYVWIVYSNNIDTNSDAPYLAHYVKGSGEYLYNIPVSGIGDEDSYKGDVTPFVFTDMEPATWTGTIKYINDEDLEISVPVMQDKETGKTILGDAERRILCADMADFEYNDTLTPIYDEDGFDNEYLGLYYNFIRTYDFYESTGWKGADGDGTPCLLLMNYVDEEGNPVDNCCYYNINRGFQTFIFSKGFGDYKAIDTVAHEFTHCITNKAVGYIQYQNDQGAINEAFSDIMANIIEMMYEDSPGGEWLFNENCTDGPFRSMKEPHLYRQPDYVWDEYYKAGTSDPNGQNDRGGVHNNTSMLSRISYLLDESGMPLDDQFYYWMNVSLAMTSSTDYPQLSEIMKWCIDNIGYDKYAEALDKAIEDTRITNNEVNIDLAGDQALIYLDASKLEELEKYQESNAYVSALNLGENVELTNWELLGSGLVYLTVPEGDYSLTVSFKDANGTIDYFDLIDDTWVIYDSNSEEGAPERDFLKIEGGKYYEIDPDALYKSAS